MSFETQQFIIDVRDRPSIWNSKCAEHADSNLRQKAWEELVDIYGGNFSQDAKNKLCVNLQKKWRNIRDAFVKTHKAKESTSGSAAKRKVPYVFYDNLLFLKDTVTVNQWNKAKKKKGRTETDNHADDNTTINEDVKTIQNADDVLNAPSPKPPAKRRKKNNKDDLVGAQLVGVLAKNLERKNMEEDDDRFFFLSLIKEFKKIPEYMQMQTKLDILKLINDAQQFRDNPAMLRSGGRPNANRGYKTARK